MVSWREEKVSRKRVWSPILKTAGSQISQGQVSLGFGHTEITGDFSKINVRRGIQLE